MHPHGSSNAGAVVVGCAAVPVDALRRIAYHSGMTHDETIQSTTPDSLTIGDLITLQQAAEYCGLAKSSLHNYAKQGRLRAKKVGLYWVTTRAAVDEYLRSRDFQSMPKKYRNRT